MTDRSKQTDREQLLDSDESAICTLRVGDPRAVNVDLPGSTIGWCNDCASPVHLSPSSSEALRNHHKLRVFCMECTEKMVAANDKKGTPTEFSHLGSRAVKEIAQACNVDEQHVERAVDALLKHVGRKVLGISEPKILPDPPGDTNG